MAVAELEKRTVAYEKVIAQPGLVREHVGKILASRSFGHAESLARLLSYLVEETLAGRAECLKEYTLGVEVFQRGADFDPRVDTIVRTQARRLRAKLQDYYGDEGGEDRIVIEIPKGTYVPRLVQRIESSPPPPVPARPIGRIVAVVAVVILLAAIATQRPVRTSLAVGRPSIAVLPFADLGSTGGQTSLGDGISEEISRALSRIATLRVASRTSTLQYKGTGVDIRKVGTNLGATAVVEGSVRTVGDRIRITAHLVNTGDGYRLWSQNWDASPAELDRVQEDAARGIAAALQIPLVPGGEPKHNTEAYRLYMKGRFGPSTNESIAWLDKALQIDPRFAAAWMAKAEIYMAQTRRALVAPAEVLPKAREAAMRSIEFGRDVAAAHVVLGGVASIYDWDWERAEKEYQRALELEPHNAFARLHYARLLGHRGRTAEALEHAERISTIDPNATALPAAQAAMFYFSRQYHRALEYCTTVLAVTPNVPDCHYWSGRALLSKGMIAEAVAALEKRQSGTGMGFGFPITAYLAASRRDEALRLRGQVEKLKQHAYVSPVSLAQVHFAFGETDEGFRQLERALQVKDQSLPTLKVEPAYDAIRADPRFQRILRTLRL